VGNIQRTTIDIRTVQSHADWTAHFLSRELFQYAEIWNSRQFQALVEGFNIEFESSGLCLAKVNVSNYPPFVNGVLDSYPNEVIRRS